LARHLHMNKRSIHACHFGATAKMPDALSQPG
jgi:hypothetical protein